MGKQTTIKVSIVSHDFLSRLSLLLEQEVERFPYLHTILNLKQLI